MTRKVLDFIDKLKILTLLNFNLKYNLMSKANYMFPTIGLNVTRSKLDKMGLAQDITIT